MQHHIKLVLHLFVEEDWRSKYETGIVDYRDGFTRTFHPFHKRYFVTEKMREKMNTHSTSLYGAPRRIARGHMEKVWPGDNSSRFTFDVFLHDRRFQRRRWKSVESETAYFKVCRRACFKNVRLRAFVGITLT